MKQNYIYISIMSMVFLGFTIVFLFFPRSTYSALEKRELAKFPKYSLESLKSGEFTKSINSWFSDSEPYRDVFMSMSMQEKDLISMSVGEEKVTFHASADATETSGPTDEELEMGERNVGKYKNNITAEENAKIANRGIIIVGKGKEVRALMAYGGSSKGGVDYAQSANEYKKVFGPKVNVYCMVIPTAVDFYCPDKAKGCSNEERPTINNIYAHLDKNVHAVDVYTALGKHVAENIFLRTDHHWAPLGAFYAAQQFAKVAKVPFKPLSCYERKVVHGYVGSMYGYSHDISLKNAPEDFVYYVPKNVKYETYYTDYKINRNYEVIGEGKPYKGIFFYKYKDGNGGAYCTFMGGDTRITRVKTNVNNHRRVMILKDSFGNALPGYLFYSFEEIHVVDYRYFTKNMRKYVSDNKITDILFANNIFNAYSNKICKKYTRFLHQNGTILPSNNSVSTSSKSTTVDSAKKQKGTHATPALKETLDAKKDSPKEQSSHHDANKKHDKQHDNQHVEKQKPESVPTESGDKQPAE